MLTHSAHHELSDPTSALNTAPRWGRLSGFRPDPETSGRWIAEISEYTEIDVPGMWPGHQQPFHYTSA